MNKEETNKTYKRWSESDKLRLKRMHSSCSACEKSGDFWLKLTQMYGEGRSVSSIQEQCLRMKLQAKRPPKSPICINEDCGISLLDKKIKRIGNFCQTCYHKKWQSKNR